MVTANPPGNPFTDNPEGKSGASAIYGPNPPDSAPEDAVELARDIMRSLRNQGRKPSSDRECLAQAVLELEKSWLEAEGKHSTAEAQVIILQKRIDKLEAVNEHIEKVNNKMYNQLLIAEAQVTALRTGLDDVIGLIVDAVGISRDPNSVLMRVLALTRQTLSATPPAAPDTTAILEAARKVLKEYFAGSKDTNLSDLSTAFDDYDQAHRKDKKDGPT